MSKSPLHEARGFTPQKVVHVKDSASLPTGTRIVTESQAIEDLAASKINGVRASKENIAAQSTEQPAPEQPKPEEKPAEETKLALTEEQIRAIAEVAATNAVKPFQEKQADYERQLAEKDAAIEAAKAEADAKVAEAEKQRDTLANVFRFMGHEVPVTEAEANGAKVQGFPMVNRVSTTKSDSPIGAAKDALSLLNSAPKVRKLTGSGSQFIHADNRELNAFVAQNKAAVIRDLEAWGKGMGLFAGSTSARVTDAATTISDIPGGFLSVLSSVMRSNNRPGFVFWQFPVTRFEFDKGMGDNIKIPRAAFLTTPANPNDRLLSGGGAFVRVDSSNQTLSTGVVSAQLQEWGLGANSSSPPVGIPTFVSAYSMIDLMQILDRNLMYDYYSFEDLSIRRLWMQTSRVIYNDKDAVTTAVTDLATAGDDGTMTDNFLISLRAYMKQLQIPPFMDECYGIVMNSVAVAQYRKDLGQYFTPPAPEQLAALTGIMNPSLYNGDTGKVNGYVGKFSGFHIWESNTIGVGTEGVNTVTLGGSLGTATAYSNFAFGLDTIGRGVGTEVEIRTDNDSNFGRISRFIWRSEETFIPLDTDPTGYSDTSTVPQQLRVIEVRNLASAV